MLRSRLQSLPQLLALPQLLSSVRGGSSSLSFPSATGAAVTAAAVAGAPKDSRHAVQLQPLRWFAAEPEPDGRLSGDVARAAHELGLDAVPFEELKSKCSRGGVGMQSCGVHNQQQLYETMPVSRPHRVKRHYTTSWPTHCHPIPHPHSKQWNVAQHCLPPPTPLPWCSCLLLSTQPSWTPSATSHS